MNHPHFKESMITFSIIHYITLLDSIKTTTVLYWDTMYQQKTSKNFKYKVITKQNMFYITILKCSSLKAMKLITYIHELT